MSDNNLPLSGFGSAEVALGEVIETSLFSYTAQTYELDVSPPFGELVKVKDKGGLSQIYGAVFHIASGGIDPGRRATIFPDGATGRIFDEQIYSANPQLNRLLRTEFGVLALGCRKLGHTGRFNYVFPDFPPPLHYSVSSCSYEEVEEFTSNPLFLRTLLQNTIAPVEELTAALLRRGTAVRGGAGHAWLINTGRHLARLLKEDYDRLRVILEKCEV